MKKIVVFGPRNPADINDVKHRLKAYFETIEKPVTIITSKKTKGWDLVARFVAETTYKIELWPMEAYWKKEGNSAGPIRNSLMAQECDWGVTGMECGGTKGTANMLKQMKKLGKKVIRI